MKEALRHLRRRDPALKAIISQVGPFDIDYHPASFHSLAQSIVYQQLSGKAAATILGRLTSRCQVQRLTPNSLLTLNEADYRAAGISTQKAASLLDLAA
ncbi:MAG: DNA-3-methyladenine glycosylase 2 family protein, partial [Acidobacteriota bacterium]